MIIVYLDQKTVEPIEITTNNQGLLERAIWVDMFCPTKEEEALVEATTHIAVPTREEMQEIEISSRLYRENGTLYMTAMMVAQSDSPDPKHDAITFIVTETRLLTIRYIEPQAFKLVVLNLKKIGMTEHTPISFLIELLDATVDRLADILELVSRSLDDYSQSIFHSEQKENSDAKVDYQLLLRQLGRNGDLNTKARESLVTLHRLISFFGQIIGSKLSKEYQTKIVSMSEDIKSLSDHVNFLSTKINFLLDATLGMVNIEQNNIIKIFSIAAVIFLPPTLIASIYGMNFHSMPELSWEYGYPFAIGLLLISAWLPYQYFKLKKWL